MSQQDHRQAARDTLHGDDARFRWMSKVFMDAADPIIIENLDGIVIDINREAEQAYGWSRDELLGKHICAIVPQDRHNQATELLRECKAGGSVRNIEALRQNKAGETITVLLTLSVLHDESGQPIGVASIAKDIREQKQAEKELRTLSRVFMDAADPIVIENLDGRVIDMNREAERAYGWSRDELIGKPIRALVPKEKHEQALELLALCKAGKDVRNIEGLRQTKSGHEIPVLLTLSLLQNDAGHPSGIASIAKDITKQKAAEQKLCEYRDHLEDLVADRTTELESVNDCLADAKQVADDANKAKSAFLANMSHELRTPMNAIIGYSEMLLEEAEEMEMGEFASDLKRIHGAGRHLLALINDVLDLSKIEAGKMDLYLESFELEDLIGEVDSTVQSLIAKKRNKFVVERGGELGEVTADLTKLRQVLFNLISNAAKFTEDGQITLAITPEVRSGVEWVTYAVSDTGIGIPPDKIGGLFEEFSQVDASTTRNFGGTGLGLSITKRFCEMMGGVIDVASEPGKGSTFSMRLPAEVRETAKPEIPEPRTLPEGACVLVIDDDPDACELIRRSLEQAGQKVAVATSGDEGLRLARKLRPVLITLDVLMPGKDGWAVLRELKADPDLKDTPVIMISMVDGNEMGYALGSTDFVSKPIDRNHLRKLLTRYSIVPDTGQVLVVDDDDNVRTLLRRLLEAEGFRVAEASDGKEALQRVNENQPDLIILDLMMPVMDGFQFAAELRAVEAWKKIPVVVSTARDLTADEHADLSGKVANILKKNATNVSDLMAQVQAFVDVHGNGA